MDAPVVNDYKKSFIARRILETFLGGLKVYFPSEASVPFYVYFFQIVFFLLIPISCGIFLHLLKNGTFDLIKACLFCGISMFLYSAFLLILSLILQKKNLDKEELEDVSMFGDEEVYLFDSPLGSKTWKFLFPPKIIIYNVLIHPAILGLVLGLSVYYLDSDGKQYMNLHPNLILTFDWIGVFAVAVGTWPLLVGSPPEPATYYQLSYDIQAITRSSHLLSCYALHAISSSFPDVLWLYYVNCFGHVVFVFTPFLWVLGALPPIDAYALWSMEQFLVIILGGSPARSNEKLLALFLQGVVSLLLIAALSNSFALFAILCSIRGYLTSLDLGWLVSSLWNRRKIHTLDSNFSPITSDGERKQSATTELILLSIFLLGVLGLGLAVHLPNIKWYSLSKIEALLDPPPIFSALTVDILWISLLLLSLILLFLQALQRLFFICGIRNIFYTRRSERMKIASSFIINSIRLGCPYVCLLFIHVLVGISGPGIDMKASYIDSIGRSIPYCYIYRHIWQLPERSMLMVSLYFTFERVLALPLRSTSWFDLNVAFRIQAFSIILIWINGLYKRLRTIFVISYTSVTVSKQRKYINYFLVGFNVAAFPLLFILAAFSAVFSFPIFPLFTLPFFMIGFPRPEKFWPYPVGYSANRCSDSIYYQQMVPYVSKGVHEACLAGKLGLVQPGEMFLLRWEDRFIWMQVLEMGFLYHSYSFKGLELQETSCHTVEASKVDCIFNRAFESDSGHGCLDDFPLHCLTPVTKIPAVGYSETRNVLTGVIDSPDTLVVIKDYFLKTLLYLFVEDRYNRTERPSESLYRTSSVRSRLGSADLKNRKVYSTLPKAEKPLSGSRLSLTTPTLSREGSASIQSGRGSRLAWVRDKRISSTATGLQEVEERDFDVENDFLRPISVTESDDNLAFRPERRLSSSEKSKKTLRFSSKAGRSYVTSVETISQSDLIEGETSIKADESRCSSESETESTKNFFTKSLPKRPKKEEFATLSFNNKTVKTVSRKLGKYSPKQIYNCSLSASFAPPISWILDHPFEQDELEDLQDSFPLSWFKFLLKQFGMLKVQQPNYANEELNVNVKQGLLNRLLEDEVLEENFRMLLAACHSTILGVDICFPTPSQVLKLFLGELGRSKGVDWIKNVKKLHYLTLRAYRIAVKLSLDHSLVGPTNNSWIDLQSALEDYTTDWFVGPDDASHPLEKSYNNKPATWNEAVNKETPSLFSLGYNDVKGVFTSHMLTLGQVELNLGRLDCETVKSLWASLTGELLYLTNDDDERYSIQAHPVILRNLTVQAADPPLGYPIFSSLPIRMGPPWL